MIKIIPAADEGFNIDYFFLAINSNKDRYIFNRKDIEFLKSLVNKNEITTEEYLQILITINQ